MYVLYTALLSRQGAVTVPELQDFSLKLGAIEGISEDCEPGFLLSKTDRGTVFWIVWFG